MCMSIETDILFLSLTFSCQSIPPLGGVRDTLVSPCHAPLEGVRDTLVSPCHAPFSVQFSLSSLSVNTMTGSREMRLFFEGGGGERALLDGVNRLFFVSEGLEPKNCLMLLTTTPLGCLELPVGVRPVGVVRIVGDDFELPLLVLKHCLGDKLLSVMLYCSNTSLRTFHCLVHGSFAAITVIFISNCLLDIVAMGDGCSATEACPRDQ